MSKVNELKRKLEESYTKERAALDLMEGGVPKTAEDTQILQRHDSEILGIKAAITAESRQEDKVRMEAAQKHDAEALERYASSDTEKAALANKVLNGYLRGVSVDELSPTERAIYQDAKLRAQNIGVDAKGGFTTTETFSRNVIKTLQFYGGMLSVVDVMTTTDGNPMNVSTNDDTANAAVEIAEAALAGQTDTDFGRIVFGAHKYTSGVFKLSNELLTDTIIDIQGLVLENIDNRFGRTFNNRFTLGDAVNKPQGLFEGAFLAEGAEALAGDVINYDTLVDIKTALDRAYLNKNAKWMFSQATEGVIRKLKDTTGQPIWSMGDMTLGNPATILGNSYEINNDMPELDNNLDGLPFIGFGDFKKAYRARFVNSVVIKRLEELYALTDEVGFVSFMRVDGQILDPKAVVVGNKRVA
jgi:HK97 family phage major capsid protein